MQTLVDNQTTENSSRLYRLRGSFWFLYFMISIALIGFFGAYLMVLPLSFLGRWFPSLQWLSSHVLQRGVGFLMKCQPWYRTNFKVAGLSELLRQNRPLLFVSNHRSHLDVFVLLTLIPKIRVLAKKELFSIPGLAAIMRASRQIPVESGRVDGFLSALEFVGQEISKGERVHVFPELTRCLPGSRTLRNFSSAPFKVARDMNALIVPLVFRNTDEAWPKGEAGISPATIELELLTPLESRNYESAIVLATATKRQIESRLS